MGLKIYSKIVYEHTQQLARSGRLKLNQTSRLTRASFPTWLLPGMCSYLPYRPCLPCLSSLVYQIQSRSRERERERDISQTRRNINGRVGHSQRYSLLSNTKQDLFRVRTGSPGMQGGISRKNMRSVLPLLLSADMRGGISRRTPLPSITYVCMFVQEELRSVIGVGTAVRLLSAAAAGRRFNEGAAAAVCWLQKVKSLNRNRTLVVAVLAAKASSVKLYFTVYLTDRQQDYLVSTMLL